MSAEAAERLPDLDPPYGTVAVDQFGPWADAQTKRRIWGAWWIR